ncbi:MAG: threonine/serine dehydratase [Brevundimonas sp.]|uniref:threonine ammonia-lyase n=1 Tax=Brevundimonas sp. TaxID=1871086 RepID=UPI00391CE46B
MSESHRAPTSAGVLDAARQLAGVAVRTPLIEHPALNARVGGRVLLKAECFQWAGSFKFRGAWNRISRLSPEEKRRGVVAYSSGNHAQGVAAAARLAGTHALIVMPHDCPAVKVAGVRQHGGEVRFYDRWCESREAIGAQIAAERGCVLVPPFDDPHVIEGQGTVGLELVDQAGGAHIDQLLCGASGGGLLAGIHLALEHHGLSPETYAVEPEGFDDHALSLRQGTITAHAPEPRPSICDALMAPQPGNLTFSVNGPRLTDAVSVGDHEVRNAIRYAASTLKLIVEPGGAVSLAALLSGRVDAAGRITAVIVSGGNIDPALLAEILREETP